MSGRAPAGCTIIFRNYLAQARVLAESFARHVPGGRFYVLVLDGLPAGERVGSGARVIAPKDLGLPYFHELCFKYNVTELSTSVKPSLLAHLLSRGEERVAYFDPDILIARPLDELWSALAAANVVLTPHLLQPLALDGHKPSERDILLSGAYNLGFIAVRRSAVTQAFLRWWEERLRDHCRIDHAQGLFTDQRWIDLAPGCFEGVTILRDAAYNVAYWNLPERRLARAGAGWSVDGRPLAFFHFSGFDPDQPASLSRHQTRIAIAPDGALDGLLSDYARRLRAAGFDRARQWGAGFGAFDNGIPLHPLLRQLYLGLPPERRARFGNPFAARARGAFLAWATSPPRGRGEVSPFLRAVHQCRYDAAARFPQVPGADAAAFARWACEHGAREMGFDPRLAGRTARGGDTPPASASDRSYGAVVVRAVQQAAAALPAGATVAVISRGDDALLRIPGRRGWHFPRTADGTYAGYYPKDAEAAVAHLRALKRRGARALLVPQSAFWWFAHYPGFRQYLERNARLLAHDASCCALFDLRRRPAAGDPRPALASIPSAAELPPVAVNVAGYFASEKGVGEAARSNVRALRAAGIPCVLNNVADSGSANIDRSQGDFSTDHPHPVSLIQVNADQVPHFLRQAGAGYLRDRYNIGCWAWELAEFPGEWRPHFKPFREIWTLSRFSLDAISRVAPIPVVRMPLCIPDPPDVSAWSRERLGLPASGFLFLFVFDCHSLLERKNPLGLLRAFRAAFGPRDDAWLVLKCSHATPAQLAALRRAARGQRVRILDRVLPREEVAALMAHADCYVSLHRAEGFGLTMAEAMALGKPVVATGYSGNCDFMHAGNSLLVRHAVTPIRATHGPYRRGLEWADPDLAHAAELLRWVYERPAEGRRLGAQAQRDIRTQFSPAAVGALMRARLHEVRDAAGGAA